MTTIILDSSVDHVFLPGDMVTGRIHCRKQVEVSEVDMVLNGTIAVAHPGHAAEETELTFLEVVQPVLKGSFIVRAGHEWQFAMRIPTEIDWKTVQANKKAEWESALSTVKADALPKQLPPTLSKFELGSARITYSLQILRLGDSNGASKPIEIIVSPPRDIQRPDIRYKTHLQKFQVHNFHLDLPEGESRRVKSVMKDFFHSRQPPSYHFDVQFSIPQTIVAGSKMRIHTTLKGNSTTSNGSDAPKVYLDNFEMVLRSHTKVDRSIGARASAHSSRRKSISHKDKDANEMHDADAQVARCSQQIELVRDKAVDLRKFVPNLGPWAGEIPSFQTCGIDRSFTVELYGTVSVAGEKKVFRLRGQSITVLAAEYRSPAQTAYQPYRPEYRQSVEFAATAYKDIDLAATGGRPIMI